MNNPLDTHTNSPVFGTTRTRLARRHALVTSDGLVPSTWPGASGVTAIFHITPDMGAHLVQATLRMEAGATLPLPPTPGIERFLYFTTGPTTHPAGSFIYLPPDTGKSITTATPATIALFEKRFEPLADATPPQAIEGHESHHQASPFLGNEGAMLQTLLPDEPAFDMAVNIFTYRPGATLPFVETHIMEHGLLMLSGMGVYRLEDDWYPVREGDVIWMAPHCPQWFVAMGDSPASYLYYKNVNRLPSLP